MKILLVAPTYLPSHRANTFQVMKMAQAVRGLGHEVRVLVPDPEEAKSSGWDSIAYHYGLTKKFDIEWITAKDKYRSYDYGFKAVRYFKVWDAHIIYTRLPQAAALASLTGIPTIFEIHDLPGSIMGPWLFRSFLRGRGARRLVVITKSLKDAINRFITPLPPYPITIVAPDGVDLNRYANLPDVQQARTSLQQDRIPQLSVSKFTVGYTGHLYPGRGIELILEIASSLPEVSFMLVGGNPQAVEGYQKEVDHRNLRNTILTGFVPNADLPVYQACCDVLLMPYQQSVEASSGGNIANYLSPMKLFEYLACGRVILSSDLPVLREVLGDQNAVMLPPDDSNAWVTALLAIKDDPTRREKIASQAKNDSRRYTWEARAERIFSFDGEV